MIEVAQKRCEGTDRLSCAVEDAMAPSGEYAALFSVFGLQQLPDHAQAIRAWTRCLKVGGVGVVIYWPMGQGVEKRGPWAHWGRLLGQRSTTARGAGPERRTAPAAIEAPGEVLVSHPLKYGIHWPNASFMFDAMTECGAWHALHTRATTSWADTTSRPSPSAPRLVRDPTARVLVFRENHHVRNFTTDGGRKRPQVAAGRPAFPAGAATLAAIAASRLNASTATANS